MNKEMFRIQAEFCKAMAHPVRLQVIDMLKTRSLSVQEIAKGVGVSTANLSQHLAVLRARGVVMGTREGNNVVYSLASPRIVEACTLIREILIQQIERQQTAILASE